MTIAEYRKIIKPLGYRVVTEKMSWGKHAIYVHAATGDRLTGNVFTRASLTLWQPLFDFIKENRDTISQLGKEEGICGLLGGC